ncbi:MULTISPECIES: DNA polymerase III subunit gamma and tau [unclassified Streptomyces]|uniref:DNA polymerase III subunit gamma and tau n=3 Tax=unclassified Streptomyces TaxID=2593676 RepID=UPI00036224EF|nr:MULTISPECIES: DNA polymerase III subunit gamma and tau [unclassified Streptomyces]MYT63388.1 DNA polymerase III subunit gamma and tau [Streptomyces sp. SID8357]MYT85638.1 DNA polymerase III subunit gamma and tau [Streptomyces sp. SID8360]MYW38811.1 DNA polymerase III subunit gamma and tau [Streptomyces sp. SID1]
MSSLALYRRYRPESFAEVIGQEHVTDPLQQALRNNRVNHAYLFSGPRGCGKTTSARILARCLNCEQGPTPTPCGECQSCQDLARNGPGSIDVIEIDAASHGGVDDARDLREKAFFGPASSRYKIYIIDEAHMVTPAGFNALLKVVEEPPEHLKFIFATTEPEKVIGTIRSRTHHYPFRLVPPGTLRSYLAEVCGKENSPVEDGVLPLVVRAGAGSVRDSMSVMDQLLAGAGDDGVTYAMATSLLGYTDGSLLDSIVDAFAAGDGAAAFEVVDRVVEGGNDPRRFVADLLERLRDLVILAAVPDAGDKGLIDAPADVVERMQAQAAVFGAAELSRAADLVNEGLTEMRGATSPRLQVELICARVLLPAAFDDERSFQARLDRLERGASFATAGTGPALGYVPGPEAHASGAGLPAGGPAAARAAVRGEALPPGPVPAEAPQAAAPGVAEAPTAVPAAPQPQAPQPHASQAQPPQPQQAPAAGSGAAPGGARPGAWPTASPAGGGAGGADAARRPGGWPTAAAPGRTPVPQAPVQTPAPAAPAPGPAASVPAPGGQDMAQGAAQVRNMWPDILEAVKNRRRFTWILLSQNAQVTGFDGSTLQLGFLNAGARDTFASSGSEEVLKQALAEQFNATWRVDAVVDPSGGGGTPPSSGGGGGRPPGPGGYQAAPSAPAPSAAPAPSYESRPAPAPQAPAPAPQPPSPPQHSGRPDPSAYDRAPAPEPPRSVAPEDDTAEADDPDLVDSALSGHELIVRELGATVVEEFTNEQ